MLRFIHTPIKSISICCYFRVKLTRDHFMCHILRLAEMGQANTTLGNIGKELDSALKSGEAQFSQMTTPSNPLEVFQTGRRVCLLSKTSCKYLRCLPDGNLDSLGVLDAYANFFVTCVAPNRFTLKNCGYNTQFIAFAGLLFVCLCVCLLLFTCCYYSWPVDV